MKVLLVEPAGGHPLRREPPFLGGEPGAERSILHAYANWNKRSAQLDAPAAVATLAAGADVLVTSAAQPWPSAVAAAVAALPPSAVHLSLTPHGLAGPDAALPGNGLTACARSGWCAAAVFLRLRALCSLVVRRVVWRAARETTRRGASPPPPGVLSTACSSSHRSSSRCASPWLKWIKSSRRRLAYFIRDYPNKNLIYYAAAE
jgi:hypothetical protein